MRYMRAMVAAFSLDVKAAHKSIRVRPSERGLLGIRVGNKLHWQTWCFPRTGHAFAYLHSTFPGLVCG